MKFFSKGVSSQYTYDALASCILNLAQNNVLMYLEDLGTPRQERLYPVANVKLPPTKVAKVVEKVLHKFTGDIMHRHAVPDSMWSVIVHYPSKAVTVDVKLATVELINELNSTFHYPHLFGALAEWDNKKTTVDWWVKLLCEISPRWAKLNQKLKGETVMKQTLNANYLTKAIREIVESGFDEILSDNVENASENSEDINGLFYSGMDWNGISRAVAKDLLPHIVWRFAGDIPSADWSYEYDSTLLKLKYDSRYSSEFRAVMDCLSSNDLVHHADAWAKAHTTVTDWETYFSEHNHQWERINMLFENPNNANALHTPAPLTVQLNLTATYERKDVADYSYYAEVRYKLSDGRMLNTHNINIVINKFTHEFMYAYINTLVDNKFLISKDELSDSLWADAQEFFNEHYVNLNTHVQEVLKENNLTPQQYEMKYLKPVTIKLIGA